MAVGPPSPLSFVGIGQRILSYFSLPTHDHYTYTSWELILIHSVNLAGILRMISHRTPASFKTAKPHSSFTLLENGGLNI